MVDMADEDLDELASLMTLCSYSNGDAIVTKGDPADGLYQASPHATRLLLLVTCRPSLTDLLLPTLPDPLRRRGRGVAESGVDRHDW